VWFCFIPFFNIYWGFQAIWGLAKDYNQFVERHGINAPRLPQGLYAAYCVLVWLTWVPFLGVVILIANTILLILIVSKTCDAINRLPKGAIGLAPRPASPD
jgi:hypothetical protein